MIGLKYLQVSLLKSSIFRDWIEVSSSEFIEIIDLPSLIKIFSDLCDNWPMPVASDSGRPRFFGSISQGGGEVRQSGLRLGLVERWSWVVFPVDRTKLRSKIDFCIQISIELKIKIATRVVNRFRLIQGSGERPFTQLTHGLCFIFITNSIAQLWLLLLSQIDCPESLIKII